MSHKEKETQEEPQIDPAQDELFAGESHDADVADIPADEDREDAAPKQVHTDMIAHIDEEL
jgi:hypothetical protein